VPTPTIVVDPGERIEVNMSVFHSRAGSILLVNEAVLLPTLSAGLDEEGLRGMVAHELSHLRPGATNGDQLSALLRALRGTFLASALAGFIGLGAPLAVPVLALALAVLLTPAAQLIARREELEANLVAAHLLGDDGPRLVVLGIAEATLAQRALVHAIMPEASSAVRLEHALIEAIGFGAPSLRAPLESWSYLETPAPQVDLSWRERALGLYGKLTRPFGDHPPLASVAAILGVAATL
jgi:Zn-dependent protease with chaperone function